MIAIGLEESMSISVTLFGALIFVSPFDLLLTRRTYSEELRKGLQDLFQRQTES